VQQAVAQQMAAQAPAVPLSNVLHIVCASNKVFVTAWALPQIEAAVNEAAQAASRWLKETAA